MVSSKGQLNERRLVTRKNFQNRFSGVFYIYFSCNMVLKIANLFIYFFFTDFQLKPGSTVLKSRRLEVTLVLSVGYQ
jgi:hypothetical protein